MTVAEILMEVLTSAGVRYLFGNPGTTELPFLDALPDSGLEYVVGLQEAVAVAAADGYAQASGQVGVVNVHVAPGVANSLSILHNAARAKSPLLLTAGQQDTRFLLHEPILAAWPVPRRSPSWSPWPSAWAPASTASPCIAAPASPAITRCGGAGSSRRRAPSGRRWRTAMRSSSSERTSSRGSSTRRASLSRAGCRSSRSTTIHGRSGAATP